MTSEVSTSLKTNLENLKKKSDWTGLRRVREVQNGIYARDEKLDSIYEFNTTGTMIEIMLDGQFACSATQDSSQEALQQAYDKALNLAQRSLNYKLYNFTADQRPPAVGVYKSPVKQKIDSQSLVELSQILTRSCKNMKVSKNILSAQSSAVISNTTTEFCSTNKSNFTQSTSQILFYQFVSAQKNKITQERSNGMEVYQGGFEFFDTEKIYEQSARLGKEVNELLEAENCPTDTRDLLIMPDQLYLQIHESIGHPLELDRILGDERNYAGWSFVKPEDFGKLQYGSSLLNISFDPTVSEELASYDFDDTGAKAKKKYLIKNGLLIAGIGSLESQTRMKTSGVACARSSSWNRAPIDRMANINLEPGDSSLKKMIGSTERGLLISTNKSWSIDDYRNKFQFGCEYAKLIENGQLTKTVKNPNYKGLSTPFWTNLKMLGSSETNESWGSFYCGKGEPNQVIRVGHSTPAALFSDVEIFGGMS